MSAHDEYALQNSRFSPINDTRETDEFGETIEQDDFEDEQYEQYKDDKL